MLRQAPPLETIETFVAAADGDSLRSVARRLALSPSAVSRRIAALEAFLGTPLFDRASQSLRLNAAGERYLAVVEPALRAIQRATTQFGPESSGRLTIATSHSIAAGWLVQRLPEVQEKLGLEIEVLPSRDPDVLRSGEAQLAIWGGMGDQPGLASEPLFDAVTIPAASPKLMPQACWTDEQLASQPLLTVQTPSGLWERWFANRETARTLHLRAFPTLQLMYEAASAGAGVVLAMPVVADNYLASGRLIAAAPAPRRLGESYSLYRPVRRTGPAIVERRFAGWLHGAIAESVGMFASIAKFPGSRG